MAMVAQIPMPRVFIIEDSLNAFATGSESAECRSSGALPSLAIMKRGARKLSYVSMKSYPKHDIRISTIAVALASTFHLLV